MSGSVADLDGKLLAHCKVTEATAVLDLTDRPGSGAVVVTQDHRQVRTLAHRAARTGIPLMVDAARYRGRHRRLAADGFDPAWLRCQREAGLPVLTDSGYLGAGDLDGLRDLLERARALGDVIAVLALDASWWFDPGRGCHGCSTGSVPPAYPSLSRWSTWPTPWACNARCTECWHCRWGIATAVAADPDDTLWTPCECPSCNGRQLDAIALAPAHEQSTRAFGHALHTLFELRDHLVDRAADRTARQESWRALCSSALFHYESLEASGQRWTEPTSLRFWYRAPVPSHTS